MNVSEPATPHAAEVWASELALKLRLLQADADDSDHEYHHHDLLDAIERALANIPESEHVLYLDCLERRFPMFGDGLSQQDRFADVAAGPSIDDLEPEELAHKLISKLDRTGEHAKESVIAILSDAGLVAEGKEELPEFSDDLFRRLKLKPGTGINYRNAFKLLAKLLDSVISMDGITYSVWQKLAPNSRATRTSGDDLRTLCGKYLSGDPNVAFSDVVGAMEKSRQINASMLGAIGALSRVFSRKFSDRLSPQGITSLVDMENPSGSIFKAKEKLYWSKYLELSGELEIANLEKTINESLAEHAEELMAGSSTSSRRSRHSSSS